MTFRTLCRITRAEDIGGLTVEGDSERIIAAVKSKLVVEL